MDFLREIAKGMPLALVLLGLLSALVAALKSVSRSKGKMRLLGSMLVGAAFLLGGLMQIMKESRLWPGALGLVGGIWLLWIGARKYRKDPDGETPAATIL